MPAESLCKQNSTGSSRNETCAAPDRLRALLLQRLIAAWDGLPAAIRKTIWSCLSARTASDLQLPYVPVEVLECKHHVFAERAEQREDS